MLIGIAGKAGSGKDTIGKYIAQTIPGSQHVSFAAPLKQFAADVFRFPRKYLYGPSELRNKPFKPATPWRISQHRSRYWLGVYNRYAALKFQFASDVVCRGARNDDVAGAITQLDSWFHTHVNCNPNTLTARHVLQTLGTEYGRNFCSDVWVNYLLDATSSEDQTYYCTDVRFENEMACISESAQSELWWVTRPNSGLSGEAGAHSSEAALDRTDLRDRFAQRHYQNNDTLKDLQNWVKAQCSA